MSNLIGGSLNSPVTGLGRGGAIQPINSGVSQIAAADGTATFVFPYVALSQVWTVTLNLPSAPDTANFIAYTGATNFGSFIGSNVWGPLQLGGGDQLYVNAKGLVPNVTYSMQLQGACVTDGSPGVSFPQPYADTVTTSTEQIYLETKTATGSVSGSNVNLTFTNVEIQGAWRSVYVAGYITGATSAALVTAFYVSCVGVQSGLTYQPFYPPYIDYTNSATGAPSALVARFAMLNGLDNQINVTVNVQYTSATAPVELTAVLGADLTPIDSAVYSELGINSTSTGVATQTQYGGVPVVNLQYATGPGTYATLPLEVTVVGGGGGGGVNQVLTAPFEDVIISGTVVGTGTPVSINLTSSAFYLYTANCSGSYAINILGAPTTIGQSVTIALGVPSGTPSYLPSLININTLSTAATGLPAQGSTYNNFTTYYQGNAAWSSPVSATLTYYTITIICTGNPGWTLLLAQTVF
jgi:hypothetical protein